MREHSPLAGILGSIGLLLLALFLLVGGIQGLARISGNEKISFGSFSVGKDGLWSMVIGGIVSLAGGIGLIVATALGEA